MHMKLINCGEINSWFQHMGEILLVQNPLIFGFKRRHNYLTKYQIAKQYTEQSSALYLQLQLRMVLHKIDRPWRTCARQPRQTAPSPAPRPDRPSPPLLPELSKVDMTGCTKRSWAEHPRRHLLQLCRGDALGWGEEAWMEAMRWVGIRGAALGVGRRGRRAGWILQSGRGRERDKEVGSVGLISGFVRGGFAKRRDVRWRTKEKHKRYYIVYIAKMPVWCHGRTKTLFCLTW